MPWLVGSILPEEVWEQGHKEGSDEKRDGGRTGTCGLDHGLTYCVWGRGGGNLMLFVGE